MRVARSSAIPRMRCISIRPVFGVVGDLQNPDVLRGWCGPRRAPVATKRSGLADGVGESFNQV
jgi:hypothetical protein